MKNYIIVVCDDLFEEVARIGFEEESNAKKIFFEMELIRRCEAHLIYCYRDTVQVIESRKGISY